jgi:voltage-gated potassium channel
MSLKIIGSIGAAAGYLALWAICGYLYQQAANRSDGDDFTFQGDIKIKAQIAAFKEKSGSIADEGIIKAIIDHHEYEKDCSNIYDDFKRKETFHTLCAQPMGFFWSLYYADMMKKAKFTNFSIDSVPHQGVPSPIDKTREAAEHWIEIRPGRPYRIDPFSIPAHDLTECCTKVILRLYRAGTSTEYSFINVKDAPPVQKGDLGNVILLASVMEQSLSFPDVAIWHMQDIMRGAYSYPLMDFLYFSAITITTVGFGDILPNSQYIRGLVMIETLLGTVLVGLFVSSLFAG